MKSDFFYLFLNGISQSYLPNHFVPIHPIRKAGKFTSTHIGTVSATLRVLN